MFSKSILRLQCVAALAIICQFHFVAKCDAQQSERPLFVIKAPSVENSSYGQQSPTVKVPKVARITFQAQESTPREDDGTDDLQAESQRSDTEDLDMKDLDLEELEKQADDLLGEDDDLEDDQPDEMPVTQWNLKPMSAIAPGIRSPNVFAWAAPNITYKPLYFEDVALERYGQTHGFIKQPWVSGIRYLKSAVFLPYFSLYDPVDSCDGPLGYCRPGDKVNSVKQKHYFGNPWSRRR